MRVDHDRFIEWAERHFDGVTEKGYQVWVNDPWWENEYGLPDRDRKCGINTDKGCFNTFKSERHGNIVEFVMFIEGCDWETALEILGDENLQSFNAKVAEFIQGEEKREQEEKPPVTLPEGSYLIESLSLNNQRRTWAENYLKKRKIKPTGLMIALKSKYRDRIVIPYYDKEGKLIYFNTRSLSGKDKLRYWGPKKEEFGVGKTDVLWMGKWPLQGETVYLTEGEFDAMSLIQCGFNAAACGGKILSDTQTEMLAPYRIALAFDADKAGEDIYEIWQKLNNTEYKKLDKRRRVTIIRPPEEYKDWNNFLVKHKPGLIQCYIERFEVPCNEDTFTTRMYKTKKI